MRTWSGCGEGRLSRPTRVTEAPPTNVAARSQTSAAWYFCTLPITMAAGMRAGRRDVITLAAFRAGCASGAGPGPSSGSC